MSQANRNIFTVGTFNTWGVPLSSPFVKERYHTLCQSIEHSSLDLLHLQEVWFYHLLAILQRELPTYPFLVYQRGLFGPQAALVTLSRIPLERVQFLHFPPVGVPPKKRWWQRALEPLKQKGYASPTSQSGRSQRAIAICPPIWLTIGREPVRIMVHRARAFAACHPDQ